MTKLSMRLCWYVINQEASQQGDKNDFTGAVICYQYKRQAHLVFKIKGRKNCPATTFTTTSLKVPGFHAFKSIKTISLG